MQRTNEELLVVQKLHNGLEEVLGVTAEFCADVVAKQAWYSQNKVFMAMLEALHSLIGNTLRELKTGKTTEQTIH